MLCVLRLLKDVCSWSGIDLSLLCTSVPYAKASLVIGCWRKAPWLLIFVGNTASLSRAAAVNDIGWSLDTRLMLHCLPRGEAWASFQAYPLTFMEEVNSHKGIPHFPHPYTAKDPCRELAMAVLSYTTAPATRESKSE